jgi:PKHD-type hydroxylase
MILKPVIFDDSSNINQTNYYWFNRGFSNDEIDKIINGVKLLPNKKATIVGDVVDDTIRKSNIKWIPFSNEWDWLYEKIIGQVKEANKIWGFDINHLVDNIQYTEYEAGGGHYDWHLDIGPGIAHRKISIVIQLSEPTEYDGGNLEFKFGGGNTTAPNSKGDVILFPSFILHRVTPVQTGNRKSLVLWVGGNHYK